MIRNRDTLQKNGPFFKVLIWKVHHEEMEAKKPHILKKLSEKKIKLHRFLIIFFYFIFTIFIILLHCMEEIKKCQVES